MADSKHTPVDWDTVRDKTIDMLVLERREMEAVNDDLLEALKALRFHFCGGGEQVHTDAAVMSMSAAAIAKAEVT